MSVTIHTGDCLDVLRGMAEASVDAVVTDPPAGIGFMGKSWDKDKGGRREWVAWLAGIMTETKRVMKPGAYALVWALPRTSHWTGWAIEDSGLLIQDRISHLFGSGFPKSKTHLKPACEDWWLAYKKGRRALNVEACRVAGTVTSNPLVRNANGYRSTGLSQGDSGRDVISEGRWPANITHDGSDEVVALFPDTSSGGGPAPGTPRVKANTYGKPTVSQSIPYGANTGSAARFYYTAKASKSDRDDGCEHLKSKHVGTYAQDEWSRQNMGAKPDAMRDPVHNHHPTCKPTELMRWLCRLITPPDGVILDPFMGSGSTGKAAVIENFSFIGIEREAEYVEIARARLIQAQGPLFAEAGD